jgi:hypothetical protein
MLSSLKHQGADSSLPFDNHLLDRLMDQAHIDVTLTTSKHNVQYLLGGHRTFFFDHMEAMGPSRYLPVLAYPKGAPEKAAYVGHGTTTAISVISAAWPFRANRMPSSKTCWPRSRRHNVLPWGLLSPVRSGPRFTRPGCRW